MVKGNDKTIFYKGRVRIGADNGLNRSAEPLWSAVLPKSIRVGRWGQTTSMFVYLLFFIRGIVKGGKPIVRKRMSFRGLL